MLSNAGPLPWQAGAWDQLLRARASDRLPHALLLHGQAGLGKGHFARALAQTLLCAQGGDTACGECNACRQFAVGNSPDFFVLEPPEDKKTIKVDQVRDLIDALALTSHGGGRRVAVIDPADAMNANAANSLLKTLEEPPGASLLMLVTARPARLPATVRSRCRQIRFVPPAEDVAVQWLIAQGVEESAARRLHEVAGRRPLKALALNEDADLERTRAIPEAATEIVLGKRNPLAVAEGWSKEPLGEVLELLSMWLAARARSQFTDVKPDPAAEMLGPQRIFKMADRLYEAERLRDTSVNPQLLLESLLAPLAPGR
ncbi:MAG TPA: DNA polymerase III subunit delta' [Gammaproteobacteria bacterium]|nr:DNA polymerase III subunit delta' [Gammaproteobacteria bacterium]